MYFIIVAAFMVVLPIGSILIELLVSGGDFFFLIGKWFVFWSVGVRLFTAGLRQVANPRFTAETIFETRDPGALKIVPELGFANIAAGVLGIASLWFISFLVPTAIYGVLFYGLAAAKHLMNSNRNQLENVATWSDLWISGVLLVFVLGLVLM